MKLRTAALIALAVVAMTGCVAVPVESGYYGGPGYYYGPPVYYGPSVDFSFRGYYGEHHGGGHWHH
jgi:hypothetical protein